MTFFWLFVGLIILVLGIGAFFGAPYVPSQKKYILRAFDHFDLGADDTLVDIGSGDGVVLRSAASYGARAIGYEINPLLFCLSSWLSLGDARVSVRLKNFWVSQLPSETTIVYAFSVSRDQKRLARYMQKEATRLKKPLKLLCFGSPLKGEESAETFEAYHLYIFSPDSTLYSQKTLKV